MNMHLIILEVSDEQLAELTKYITNMQPEYRVLNPSKLLKMMLKSDVQDVVGYLLTKTHEGLQNVIGSCLKEEDCVGIVEREVAPSFLKQIAFPECGKDCAALETLGVCECESICGWKFHPCDEGRSRKSLTQKELDELHKG